MHYHHVIGLDHLKKHLQKSVDNGRIAHAQLFVGQDGGGALPLAIAYARAILCKELDPSDKQHRMIDQLAHPDLHFSFPTATNDRIKSDATSDDFLPAFRSLLATQAYANKQAWLDEADLSKKNIEIKVKEAALINRKLSLKSFYGGYKVLIMWQADLLNPAAANKLLKLIEEPPNKSVILLVAESTDHMLNTIISRCQVLDIPRLSNEVIAEALQKHHGLDASSAYKAARQSDGNYYKAIQIGGNTEVDLAFEKLFVQWVRAAYKAKTKKVAITELMEWAEHIARFNKEQQNAFLQYALSFFRQSMLYNYQAHDAVFLKTQTSFKLENFAPFITGDRMVHIKKEIEDAMYHLQRNANAKVVLTDLAIGLTRVIHSK